MESCVHLRSSQHASCTVFLDRRSQLSSLKDRRDFRDFWTSWTDAVATQDLYCLPLFPFKGVKLLSLEVGEERLTPVSWDPVPREGVEPGGSKHCDFLVLISETLANQCHLTMI